MQSEEFMLSDPRHRCQCAVKEHCTSTHHSERWSNNTSGLCARCCVVHSSCYKSREVPGYLYGGADGSPACAQHFLPVGASLWQMGPGSWTKLISSTPPLKGTACSTFHTHSPKESHDDHYKPSIQADCCCCAVTSKLNVCVYTNATLHDPALIGDDRKSRRLIVPNLEQYVYQWNWLKQYRRTKEKWRKRWSISLKLRHWNDYSTGCVSTSWQPISNGGFKFAVTFVDFASKACKYKMPPPFALPGPDHVCARRSQSWHVDNSHQL